MKTHRRGFGVQNRQARNQRRAPDLVQHSLHKPLVAVDTGLVKGVERVQSAQLVKKRLTTRVISGEPGDTEVATSQVAQNRVEGRRREIAKLGDARGGC